MAAVPAPIALGAGTAPVQGGEGRWDIGGQASTYSWPPYPMSGSSLDSALESRLRRLEAMLATLQEEIEEQPTVYNAQILDLGESGYSLKCPLLVTVEVYADEVVSSVPEFDLYASGISDAMALMNLKAEIVATHKRLIELGLDQLGPLPRQWLAAMDKVMEVPDA